MTEADGGADRDRTDDPRLAKPVLSQLSYSPRSSSLVGLGRFELPTSRLSGGRSNQLSYRPEKYLLRPISAPEKRITCGDDDRDRSEAPPIERVTGRTRDSELHPMTRMTDLDLVCSRDPKVSQAP